MKKNPFGRGKTPSNVVPFRAKLIGGPQEEMPQGVNPYQMLQNMANAIARSTAAAFDMGVKIEKLIKGGQVYMENLRSQVRKADEDFEEIQRAIEEGKAIREE